MPIHMKINKTKRPGKCKTCLWHWPEVHGAGGFRCYCQESAHYHEDFSEGCRLYELRVPSSPLKISWGDQMERHRKSTTGYGKPNERE